MEGGEGVAARSVVAAADICVRTERASKVLRLSCNVAGWICYSADNAAGGRHAPYARFGPSEIALFTQITTRHGANVGAVGAVDETLK